MKPALLFFFIAFALEAKSQDVEKIWFNNKDSVYGYYTVIKPWSNRIQATLLLMNGYSGNASDILSQTLLHQVAASNDLLTVCVPTGFRLYADQSITDLLNSVCKEVITKYHVKNDRFVLGGFSSGGTILLRYAELCKEQPSVYPIQPAAVFTGDSPVDLLALYQSSQRDLKKPNPGWWTYESNMIIEKFDKEIGKPASDLSNYKKISPFLLADSTSGNEKWLRDVPYRTYHDVDVNWYIQNRRRSLYETNMLNASELVNRLAIMGNTNAEFVSARVPGRRYDGQRHPHVWSIIDEIDLVHWMREKLHFYPDQAAKSFVYKAPTGWSTETILFPIDFAASLPYEGFEELRFAPGWGDTNSNEKWGYTILWWLNGKYSFDETTIRKDLETYFSGLTHRRAVADSLNMSAYFPAKAEVQKIKPDVSDVATFTATVKIFDAQVTRKPGTLYIKVHLKKCVDTSKTIVLFEIAGNPFSTPVWQQLDKINADFKCEMN